MTRAEKIAQLAEHDDHLARRLAMALISMSIVFSLVPFTLSMGSTGPEAGHQLAQGSSLRQIQYGSIFLAAGWLAWRWRGWTWEHVKRANPFLLIVVVYCFASMMWSAAPMVSVKRAILLLGLIMIGLATAPPVGRVRQCSHVMMYTLTALVAISMVVSIAIPSVGVDRDLGNAWRGILWQKNVLGSIAGFALIFWVREFLIRELPRRICVGGALLSAFVMVMSKSTTALLVTSVGIGIYVLLRRRYLAGRHTSLQISLVVLVLLMLITHFFYVATGRLPTMADIIGPITALLNKSSDLTGRGDIWLLVMKSVDQHKIWGMGYGAFWLGDGSASQYIKDILTWMPSNGHNGYIDILNELGAVGLGLTIGLLLWHVYQLIRLFAVDREEAALHFAVLILILISNFSESQLLADVSFQNIFIFYSSLTVSAILDMDRKVREKETHERNLALQRRPGLGGVPA